MKIVLNKDYSKARALEYPSIEEQLDLLYHGGFEAWKEKIMSIKEKFPKETSE